MINNSDKLLELHCSLCEGTKFTVWVTMVRDYYDDYVATYEGATKLMCNNCLAVINVDIETN